MLKIEHYINNANKIVKLIKSFKLLIIIAILGGGSTVNAQTYSYDKYDETNYLNTGFYVEGGAGAFLVANEKKYEFKGTATVNGVTMNTLKIEEKPKNSISAHVEIGYTFNNWFALGLSSDYYNIDQEISGNGSYNGIKGSEKFNTNIQYTDILIKAVFIQRHTSNQFLYFSLGAGNTIVKRKEYSSYIVPAVGVGLGIKNYFSDNFYMKVGLDATVHLYGIYEESISRHVGAEKLYSTITTGIQLKLGYQF